MRNPPRLLLVCLPDSWASGPDFPQNEKEASKWQTPEGTFLNGSSKHNESIPSPWIFWELAEREHIHISELLLNTIIVHLASNYSNRKTGNHCKSGLKELMARTAKNAFCPALVVDMMCLRPYLGSERWERLDISVRVDWLTVVAILGPDK